MPAFKIKQGIVDGVGTMAARVKQVADESNVPIIIAAIVGGILIIVLIVWYIKKLLLLEYPDNIRGLLMKSIERANIYQETAMTRKSLKTYLSVLKKDGVPASHTALTNFYISTVNATSFFFPAEDGVYSADAARLAVLGGARAFVFDIWPDLANGGNFGPIVQTVEDGGLWRRISINAITFQTALAGVIDNVYGTPINQNETMKDDPVILYLRFRGKPRFSTFEGTANALRSKMEQYRLDPSYNACRSMDKIFRTSVTELFKKVIVMSNMRAEGSRLQDYINVAPAAGIRTEINPREIRGMTDAIKAENKARIQQNLMVALYNPEKKEAASNEWNFKDNQSIGVHMCAMNFFNPNATLKQYMAPEMFGIYSYSLKPRPLRYVVEVLPKPLQPQNPGWGSGQNAGKPTIPESIKL
jgi:hypothetical protein